jgi:hypothetical protein
MEIAVNNDSGLFVVSAGNSSISEDFKSVLDQALELKRRLEKQMTGISATSLPVVLEDEIGTVKQYMQYRELLSQYALLGDRETWFNRSVPSLVCSVLESARRIGATLRLFVGDPLTGRDWMCCNDALGRIGRSDGPMRVPILMPTNGQHGGGAILVANLVRIVDADTRTELYRHPGYHQPALRIIDAEEYDQVAGFTHSVQSVADEVRTVLDSFESLEDATHRVSFLQGLTFELSR